MIKGNCFLMVVFFRVGFVLEVCFIFVVELRSINGFMERLSFSL